jgi:hypothetical protein
MRELVYFIAFIIENCLLSLGSMAYNLHSDASWILIFSRSKFPTGHVTYPREPLITENCYTKIEIVSYHMLNEAFLNAAVGRLASQETDEISR